MACADGAAPRSKTLISDSAGIRIAFTAIGPDAVACSLSEPVLRIGAIDAQSGSVLYGVNGAAVLGDGRIAIVNRGTSQIKLFSATGTALGEFGRQGPGPDEFKNLWSIAVRGPDTLVVGDYRPWRFSFYTPTGELHRRVELKPPVIERPNFALPLGSGSGFIMEEPLFRAQDAMVDRVVPLHRYDEDGELRGDVGPFWLDEFGYLARDIGYVGNPIFGAKASFLRVGEEQFLYATGRHEQLEIWSRDGDLRRIVRWQARDRSIGADDAEVWRRKRREEIEARFQITPQMEPFIAAQVGPNLPVAAQYPGHDRVVVSQTGEIWVQQYRRPLDEGPNPWWVFSGSGEFVCAALLPKDLSVLAIDGTRVLGLSTDSLDVEYVLGFDVSFPADRRP
jgi:hypothetical protein